MDLNKAMIIGHVTRDPEVRTTPQGVNVCSFSVATNFVWNDANGQKQEKAEFHNIVAWRKLADICGQYLKKGRKVYVEGRMQTRDWEDQNGVKRYRTEVVADNMILLDRVNQGTNNQSGSSFVGMTPPPVATEPAYPVVDTTPAPANTDQVEEDSIKVEDIPF